MAHQDLTDIRTPIPLAHVPRPPHLKALTSIRFFAAMYVAVYHMVRPFTLWGIFSGFFAAGYTAVSFFFLLSGFILTYAHAAEYEQGKGDAARFWVARFARIYPVYLVSMIAAGILGRQLFEQHIHIVAYIADLLMVQTWSVRMAPFFNVPAWSLSVEAFFYFVFPFCILRLRPSTARRAVWTMVLLWVLALLPSLVILKLYPNASGAWHEYAGLTGGHWVYRIRRLPPLLLPIFLSGIPLAWIYLRYPPSRRASFAMALGGILSVLATLFFADHLPFAMLHNGLLVPFFALVILGLCGDNAITRALSIAPLVLLGEASYALYLTHFMFNDWTSHQFNLPENFYGLFLRLLVLIPLSLALHLWVERPGRRMILKYWTRHQARKGAASR